MVCLVVFLVCSALTFGRPIFRMMLKYVTLANKLAPTVRSRTVSNDPMLPVLALS